MPWVRFDDATTDHPKFSVLQDYAPLCGWLWFAASCYSSRFLTNGRIDIVTLRRLWPYKHIGVATAGIGDGHGEILAEFGDDPSADDLVKLLTQAKLLDEIEPGLYRVHDFLKYNPSRKEVLKARKENAKRQQGFRDRSRNAVTNDVTNALINHPHPHPHPQEKTSKKTRSELLTQCESDEHRLEHQKQAARKLLRTAFPTLEPPV